MHYLELAERAARESGELLIEKLGMVSEIEYKAKNSLVTDVDKLSEHLIIRRIRERYPSHAFFCRGIGKGTKEFDPPMDNRSIRWDDKLYAYLSIFFSLDSA